MLPLARCKSAAVYLPTDPNLAIPRFPDSPIPQERHVPSSSTCLQWVFRASHKPLRIRGHPVAVRRPVISPLPTRPRPRPGPTPACHALRSPQINSLITPSTPLHACLLAIPSDPSCLFWFPFCISRRGTPDCRKWNFSPEIYLRHPRVSPHLDLDTFQSSSSCTSSTTPQSSPPC